MDIFDTPEEAAAQAKADAEAAGVSPQAVMYSSPAGYGVGSEDQVTPAAEEGTAPVSVPESVPEPTKPREVRDESATAKKTGKKG